jgi:hypothetical protein
VDDPGDRGIGPAVIESCRRGDRDAFGALYAAYKDRVYSIAFYFFHGDAQSAHDVTQQVFLKLIDNIARFRGDASFSRPPAETSLWSCSSRRRRNTWPRKAARPI